MKSTLSAFIAILIINSSAYAYVTTINKYYPDYIICSSIVPVMSEDSKSVISWQSSIKIKRGTNSSYVKAWSASETNVMRFDLTESQAANTVTEFITPATNWLEAQQDMFVNAHMIAIKINKYDKTKLTEISYGQVDFVNTDNVKLIDLSNGIIPTGEMVTFVPVVPEVPVLVSPANGTRKFASPVTLTWNSAARAISYKVGIKMKGGVYSYRTTTDTSYQMPVIVGNTEVWFYWTVTAVNDDGESNASSENYFTTIR